ncbi:MAG TPA: nucleotidyltransferase domain-containing protein [Candidatus Hydrogenedentes bacterium]|nr:nucleotidyltransferase domain-containing protein [Candidatus Hydrogenedentota bacterium]
MWLLVRRLLYNPAMAIEQQILDEIVRRVISVVPAARIILFGSAATGQMTRDSDIDLLILEDTVTDPRKERLHVRQALRGLGYPFDVILMTKDRFEETKGVIGGIAYPANKYGRVIYDAA